MILVDGLYVHFGGAMRVLEYLVRELDRRGSDFHLLADRRCEGVFDGLRSVEYLDASLWNRARWYRRDLSRFTAVMCVGNIAPPVKLPVPVYTLSHNINVLTLEGFPSFPARVKGWLKRVIYRHYRRNTDYWLVQTENTRQTVIRCLHESEDRVKTLLFYYIPASLAGCSRGDDYLYVSTYYRPKHHEELLAAWRILHGRGVDKTLHLTLEAGATEILAQVAQAQREGVRVVNHGFLPMEEMPALYAASKATVYPSINESLGLGIVEAITAGCDVIGADLPYMHAVCRPSAVFDPSSPESIADAVERYEKGGMPRSELLVRDQIDTLIDVLEGRAQI